MIFAIKPFCFSIFAFGIFSPYPAMISVFRAIIFFQIFLIDLIIHTHIVLKITLNAILNWGNLILISLIILINIFIFAIKLNF